MTVSTESAPTLGTEGLQVGGWSVEPALHLLAAAGNSVKIEPKAMAVLVYLAGRPGQVVSREALLAAVWPGVVVGDDSLGQVVTKLRKALGDVPEKPAYIRPLQKAVTGLSRPWYGRRSSPPRRFGRMRNPCIPSTKGAHHG